MLYTKTHNWIHLGVPTCPFVGGPRHVRVAHYLGPPSCQALRTQYVYAFVNNTPR